MEETTKIAADGKARVTANEKGEIFTIQLDKEGKPKLDKNGKQFGYIRLEQVRPDFGKYAYLSGGLDRRSTLQSMTLEAFNNVKDFYYPGMVVKGNIVIQDRMDKPHDGFKPRQAGKDGEMLTKGGNQIYRNTFFDPTGKAEDDIVEHDNVIKYNPNAIEKPAGEKVADKNAQSLN